MLSRTQKITKRIGRRVRELRLSQKISQEALADSAGMERAYYWKLENGRINATVESLVKISDALEVDIAELFVKPSPRKLTK